MVGSLKSLAATFAIALLAMGAIGYFLLVAAAIQRSPGYIAGIELFLFIWLLIHFITTDDESDGYDL